MYEDLTADQKAQRALDYMEIQNCIAGHVYCYRAQQQRYELDHFWAQEHDDICYAHENFATMGRQSVYNYYAGNNEYMNKEKLRIFSEKHPDVVQNVPENIGIGDLVARLMTTPYVVIAKDGQTAKGLWYSAGLVSEVDEDFNPAAYFHLGKFAVDFIKETTGWKIWHFRMIEDFWCPVDKYYLTAPRGMRRTVRIPKDMQNIKFEGEYEGEFVLFEDGPNPAFSPTTPAGFSPKLPEPYDTWDDSMSWARVNPNGVKMGPPPEEDEAHTDVYE